MSQIIGHFLESPNSAFIRSLCGARNLGAGSPFTPKGPFSCCDEDLFASVYNNNLPAQFIFQASGFVDNQDGCLEQLNGSIPLNWNGSAYVSNQILCTEDILTITLTFIPTPHWDCLEGPNDSSSVMLVISTQGGANFTYGFGPFAGPSVLIPQSGAWSVTGSNTLPLIATTYSFPTFDWPDSITVTPGVGVVHKSSPLILPSTFYLKVVQRPGASIAQNIGNVAGNFTLQRVDPYDQVWMSAPFSVGNLRTFVDNLGYAEFAPGFAGPIPTSVDCLNCTAQWVFQCDCSGQQVGTTGPPPDPDEDNDCQPGDLNCPSRYSLNILIFPPNGSLCTPGVTTSYPPQDGITRLNQNSVRLLTFSEDGCFGDLNFPVFTTLVCSPLSGQGINAETGIVGAIEPFYGCACGWDDKNWDMYIQTTPFP